MNLKEMFQDMKNERLMPDKIKEPFTMGKITGSSVDQYTAKVEAEILIDGKTLMTVGAILYIRRTAPNYGFELYDDNIGKRSDFSPAYLLAYKSVYRFWKNHKKTIIKMMKFKVDLWQDTLSGAKP